MKKLFVFIISMFCVVGCSCMKDKASDAVEKYLNDYKGLNENVINNMDQVIAKENLEDKDKETYKGILEKQYRDLTYTIENESYDGDTAKVTAKITVYDLYKANKNSSDYLNEHQDEFVTDGIYDSAKYIKYKLEELTKMKDTVSYTIVFNVKKENSKWIVEQPSDEDLQKIHGIYNYEK